MIFEKAEPAVVYQVRTEVCQALGICQSISKPQDKCVFRVEQGSGLITVAGITRLGEVKLSVPPGRFQNDTLLSQDHFFCSN